MGIENVINDILANLRPKCAVSNFAAIAKILSIPRVTSALAGREPFKNEDALSHLAVARKLKALSDLTAPLPLDYKETETIRAVLDGVDKGNIRIGVFQNEPVAETVTAYSIKLKNGDYFAGVARGVNIPQVRATFNFMRSVTFTKEAGEQAIVALEAHGWPGSKLVENKFASEDGITFDIKTVGL
jgi:hypothetical protein